ncbi:MAG TPA: tetratricopeptide repeat protein [Mycobacteriales bacterium]|nr:tetratricopeptide repeat protein [Mycobacteriales bacterium]
MTTGAAQPADDPDGFGPTLRRLRIAARLTQDQLAERARLSARALGDIERGRVRNPRPDTVRLLATALGLAGAELDRFETLARAEYWAGRETSAPATPASPPSQARPRPAQLPADVAAFTGRAEALDRLDGLLAAGPATAVVISAITGTAGVGKTALAVHWAQQARGRFADGQLYVNLRGYDAGPAVRPVEALARFLHALGVPPEQVPVDLEEAAGLYRSLLADRRMLIVADNAGHPDQVRPLLPGSPGCLVLVTSRDQMAGLVARDGAQRLTIDVLTPAEAGTLLGRVLGPARVAAEPAAADQLARLCGYLPLALRIAAANLTDRPGRSIESFAAELAGGDRLSALGVAGDEQAAVRAAFDLSYATLAAPARLLFRRLGLAPGPDITAPAATALISPTAEPADQPTERVLDRLAAAHLLGQPAPGRYALHDLLRHYAAERADRDDSGADRAAAVRRLLDWYLHTADAAARVLYPTMIRLDLPEPGTDGAPPGAFADHIAALAWLTAERDNLLAAIRFAAEHGPRPAAWLLADTIRGYFWHARYTVDWLETAHAGLAAATAAGDLQAQAGMQMSLGMAYYCLERHLAAVEHYTAAAELARRAGWIPGQLASIGNLGNAYADLGNLRRAADCHTEALELNRQAGQLTGQLAVLCNLGVVYQRLGQLQRAADCETEAMAVAVEIGSPAGEAAALGNLGGMQHDLGQLDEAAANLSRALGLHREIGNRYAETHTLLDLAAVHHDAGRNTDALRVAQEARDIAQESSARRIEADILNLLGSIHRTLGHPQQAAGYHQQALRISRDADAQLVQTAALIGLAAAHRDRKQTAKAAAYAREALDTAHDAGYAVLDGNAQVTLASIELAGGNRDAAVSHARAALEIHRETGHRLGQARALTVLGQAAQQAGDAAGATGHWQQALVITTECGADSTELQALLTPAADRRADSPA